MSSGLKGSIASLHKFQADLRKMASQVTANKVAAAAAPVLTALVKGTFGSSEDAYGNSWSPGAEGQVVTLRDEGKLADKVEYTAIGTKIRLKLGVPYAKYQVGKRPVAPTQGGALPVSYSAALARTAVRICREALQ